MVSLNKFIELFKNLKSDAVPRSPRPTDQTPKGRKSSNRPEQTQDDSEEQEEEIIIEPEDINKNEKKKTRSKSMKIEDDDDDDDVRINGEERGSSTSTAHIQATGTVYNIMNSKHVRLGNDFYFGPVTQTSPTSETPSQPGNNKEEHIKKDNNISLLMEAKIRPDHDYMDYIAKNLGKNWKNFFRSLNFTQGRIETAEINAIGYDISEARYKLLRDWVNNDDDGTLGRLATLLWAEGERSIVKHLSLMYKKSKK